MWSRHSRDALRLTSESASLLSLPLSRIAIPIPTPRCASQRGLAGPSPDASLRPTSLPPPLPPTSPPTSCTLRALTPAAPSRPRFLIGIDGKAEEAIPSWRRRGFGGAKRGGCGDGDGDGGGGGGGGGNCGGDQGSQAVGAAAQRRRKAAAASGTAGSVECRMLAAGRRGERHLPHPSSPRPAGPPLGPETWVRGEAGRIPSSWQTRRQAAMEPGHSKAAGAVERAEEWNSWAASSLAEAGGSGQTGQDTAAPTAFVEARMHSRLVADSATNV